jgi:NagD protein
MGRAILGRLNIEPADAVMVGDRLLTDIAMGQSLGMASVLILTGVSSLEDIGRSGVQPDFVIDKLLDLLPSERD